MSLLYADVCNSDDILIYDGAGQYGQWATAAAATSPVDVSHTMAYGGDGPFVDDATYPTRRSSLQQALDREGNSSAKSTSTTIEKRLNAVFVYVTNSTSFLVILRTLMGCTGYTIIC